MRRDKTTTMSDNLGSIINWTNHDLLNTKSPASDDLDPSLTSADFDASLSDLELGNSLYGALT